MNLASIALASLALFGAASAAVAADGVILPGRVDQPVIRGEARPDSCSLIVDPADPMYGDPNMQCVSMKGADLDEAMNAYTRSLMSRGWVFAGGASVQFWLERPAANGRCEGLDMTALADFSKSKAEIAAGPAIIAFQYEASRDCRAQKD